MKIFRRFNAKIWVPVAALLQIFVLIICTIAVAKGGFEAFFGKSAKGIGLILVLIALLSGIVILLVFNAYMGTIREITSDAKKLSEGDYNISDIMVKEEGEMKIMAESFNEMKRNLLFFIGQTKMNIITLTDSIENVTSSMDNTVTNTTHITEVVQTVAQNTVNQLGLVEDTVNKIEEVSASSEKIATHIIEVKQASDASNEAVAKGRSSLDSYNASINIISDSLGDTADFIEKLRDSINDIADVIGVIGSVSNQLKMLALNASIEAARAGEAGKGFAIVAQEITVLSDQTTSDVERINEVLAKMLENSSNVESGIQKSVADFAEGREVFNDALAAFADINEKNAEVVDKIGSVDTEVAIINQLAQATADLSRNVYQNEQEVSGSTQEVVSITEEELADISEINENVSSLNEMLTKIQKLVDRYSLDIKPTTKKASKKVRIAVVCPYTSLFWHDIGDGVTFAIKELAAVGADVDFYPVESQDDNVYIKTFQDCIDQKYDGIALVAHIEKLAPYVDKAVDAGIPVVTFNSEFAAKSKRMAFVGQNAYDSGVVAAEALAKQINYKGDVLVATSNLSIANHEIRRDGFNKTLAKYKGIKIVEVLETHEKNDETCEKVYSYIRQRPVDAIFLTAGGQDGIAKAVEKANMKGKVKAIVYDFMPSTLKALKDGYVTGTIGQDPFRQGHDPVIYLYNKIVAGINPPEEYMWTRIEVVDAANVDYMM